MGDAQLLAQLANERQHVLRAVDGLAEDAMHRVIVPSVWTITRLLNHLAYDDERFWISAVLSGDVRAIEALHDGWASDPMTGAEAIETYKRERSERQGAQENRFRRPSSERQGAQENRFRRPSPVEASSRRLRGTTAA
ncbi:DUF664 domain-containing protein [Cryobacterium sp. TMT1-3]|uniref:mycothiol transferase n=1 Tax=Cryobacterium sp. TMT1-3 TaxID=1259237 RepID=UPI002106F3D2|nr:DUF664 domain-containing protein [Cryobacterium sp. TMT1-3]